MGGSSGGPFQFAPHKALIEKAGTHMYDLMTHAADDETIGLAKLEFFKNNTVKFGSSNARVPLGVAMLRQQYKKKFLVSMIEMMKARLAIRHEIKTLWELPLHGPPTDARRKDLEEELLTLEGRLSQRIADRKAELIEFSDYDLRKSVGLATSSVKIEKLHLEIDMLRGILEENKTLAKKRK